MPNKKKWKNACSKAISQAAGPNIPEMFIAVEGNDRDPSRKDPRRKLRSFPVRGGVQP
jgi:hypothetical protein